MDYFNSHPMALMICGALVVFLSTSAGALPILGLSKLSQRIESSLLGASAGVMLGATFFSLLLPALEIYQKHGKSPLSSATWVGFELLAGAVLLYWFHRILPHEHFAKGPDHQNSEHLSRQWLVILAVALHNLPEGLAVGTGLGSGDSSLGFSLASAIALQDFPEGLIVALGMRAIGFSFPMILTVTAFTGLIEAVGVLLGFTVVSVMQSILPLAFALCSGAMLFVVSHEVIPESHRRGYEREATSGVMLGFVVMMLLDLGLS